MAEWNVNLTLIDDRSRKFWRARIDGTELHVNYGRIGTKGQTQLKSFASADKCVAGLQKLERSKRRKGYDDAADEASAAPAPEAAGPRQVGLVLDEQGRKLELELTTDSTALRTAVVEHYQQPAEAEAALERLITALTAEGYRPRAAGK